MILFPNITSKYRSFKMYYWLQNSHIIFVIDFKLSYYVMIDLKNFHCYPDEHMPLHNYHNEWFSFTILTFCFIFGSFGQEFHCIFLYFIIIYCHNFVVWYIFSSLESNVELFSSFLVVDNAKVTRPCFFRTLRFLLNLHVNCFFFSVDSVCCVCAFITHLPIFDQYVCCLL